jgi:hypothetical protein
MHFFMVLFLRRFICPPLPVYPRLLAMYADSGKLSMASSKLLAPGLSDFGV